MRFVDYLTREELVYYNALLEKNKKEAENYLKEKVNEKIKNKDNPMIVKNSMIPKAITSGIIGIGLIGVIAIYIYDELKEEPQTEIKKEYIEPKKQDLSYSRNTYTHKPKKEHYEKQIKKEKESFYYPKKINGNIIDITLKDDHFYILTYDSNYQRAIIKVKDFQVQNIEYGLRKNDHIEVECTEYNNEYYSNCDIKKI